MDDKQIMHLMMIHDGDYQAAAAAAGYRPDRLLNRYQFLVGQVDDPHKVLLGRALAYRETANRLAAHRRMQNENRALRREARYTQDAGEFGDKISEAIKAIKPTKIKQTPYKEPQIHTHEWLLSDLHFGKKSDGYNTMRAKYRLETYADQIVGYQGRHKPKHTVIAILGDLIENAHKHRDSRNGCEIDTAEQISGAYKLIANFLRRVLPRAGKVRIIGVAGNHENIFGAGSVMNWRGRSHLSSIIYEILRETIEADIEWNLPDGVYAVDGDLGAIYEHGDNTIPTEKAMQAQLDKRARQAKAANKYMGDLTYFRQGDKHVSVMIDNGRLACNGAFFSDATATEFSGVAGYYSTPYQIGFAHHANAGIVNTMHVRLF